MSRLSSLSLTGPFQYYGNHEFRQGGAHTMTDTTSRRNETSAPRCPVTHADFRVNRPLFQTYETLNAERERSPFLLNDSTKDPFFMIQRYDHVLEALQMPDVFSSEVVNALDPFMEVTFLPNNLNPPEHTRMRKVLRSEERRVGKE